MGGSQFDLVACDTFDWLTAAQASEVLGVSPKAVWTVWRTYGNGDHTLSMELNKAKRVYRKDAVEAWAAALDGQVLPASDSSVCSKPISRRMVSQASTKRLLTAFFKDNPRMNPNSLAAYCTGCSARAIRSHLNGQNRMIRKDIADAIKAGVAAFNACAQPAPAPPSHQPTRTAPRERKPVRRSCLSRFLSWLAAKV